MSVVSENVERIIREKGLKKGYVAHRAGLKANTLSSMLHGRKRITDEHVATLARALECTPNELYGFPCL